MSKLSPSLRVFSYNLLVLVYLSVASVVLGQEHNYQLNNWADAETYIQSFSPESEEWFKEYIELDIIDGLYSNLAKQMGGVAIIGGSDLSDIILGEGIKVSSIETNIMHPLDSVLANQINSGDSSAEIANFNSIKGSIPTLKLDDISTNKLKAANADINIKAPGFANKLIVNFNELSQEWTLYRDSTNKQIRLFANENYLQIGLKHQYLVVASADKKQRIYFKNQQAKEDYQNKTLRLPSEYDLVMGPLHVYLPSDSRIYILKYNIMLLAKGMSKGWRLSERSSEYLKSLAKSVSDNPEELHVLNRVLSPLWEQTSNSNIETALKYLGLTTGKVYKREGLLTRCFKKFFNAK